MPSCPSSRPALGFAAVLVLLGCVAAFAADNNIHDAGESVPAPAAVLAELKAGNDRYVAGKPLHPHANLLRREDTAGHGQHPHATCLTCADSRVPVELIFDQGVGDIFVVRDAGNVCGAEVTGTIEYGVEHLGTPLLVIMGHTKCGAVTAAATGAHVGGSIPHVLHHIMPAVLATLARFPEIEANALIPEIIKANVWQSIAELYQSSAIVRGMVREGKLNVVGAVYDIQSGMVQWLGPLPHQKDILALYASDDAAGEATAAGHEKKPAHK